MQRSATRGFVASVAVLLCLVAGYLLLDAGVRTVSASSTAAVSFVDGPSEQPGISNTGVPAGVRLTRIEGNLVIRTDDTVYDSLDVNGFVFVHASNVHITRSIIRGGIARSDIALVNAATPRAKGLVIEDTELAPSHPSVYLDGIKGWNYTLRRVNAHGTVDIAKVYGDDVRIEASWLHDNQDYANDPHQEGSATHNDGVQVLSGSRISIVGNTISGASNAALQVTQDRGPVKGLVFDGNWVSGGACTVNISAKGGPPKMSGITVRNNRFGRNARLYNCAVISGRGIALSTTGNVWADDGRPAPVHRGGEATEQE